MSEVSGEVEEKEGGEARHGRHGGGGRRHFWWPEPDDFAIVPGKQAILPPR